MEVTFCGTLNQLCIFSRVVEETVPMCFMDLEKHPDLGALGVWGTSLHLLWTIQCLYRWSTSLVCIVGDGIC